MKIKKLAYSLTVALASVFLAVLARGSVYAGGTGDVFSGDSDNGAHSGCSGTNASNYASGSGSFNCCFFGSRCPHWNIGTPEEFKSAMEAAQAQGRDYISANRDNYERCARIKEPEGWTVPEQVVWVGTDNGTQIANNDKGSAAHPYKTTRFNDFTFNGNHVHFDWGDPMNPDDYYNSQHTKYTLKDGTEIENTIGGVHQYAAKEQGNNDDELVFFCASFNTGDTNSGTVISKSVAKGSAGDASASANTGFKVNASSSGEMEVSTTDSSVNVRITFTQYLQAKKAPAATKYHVKYTIEKATGVSQRPGGSSDKTIKLNNTSAYTAYGGAYNVSFTIPKNAKGDYKVCEKIIYTPNSKGGKIVNDGKTQYTEACIVVKAQNADEISCSALKSTIDAAHKAYYTVSHDHPSDTDPRSVYGNYKEAETGALSRVTGGSLGSSLGLLTYAKPNDNIRFIHCYYPDAYKVTDLSGSIVAKQKDNICLIRDESTNGGDYLFPKIESFAEGGGSGKCYDSGTGKVKNQETFPIISFAPKRTSKAYSNKKGYYKILPSAVDDLGTQFRQYVEYNDIFVHYAWDDIAVPYRVCVEYDEEGHCLQWETRYHHPHRNGRTESYTVSGDESKPARVAVPYNFDTEIEVAAYGDANITYPGSEFRVEVSGMIKSAKNENRGKTYTTATPNNSRVEVVQFTLPPSAGTGGLSGTNNTYMDPTAYARSIGAQQVISATLATGSFNPDSEENYEIGSWEKNSTVPDVETGTKICTLAGIYPTDSHGMADSSKSGGYKKSDPGMEGFLKSGGSGWRISGVTCRTIVKRPSFQIWSGGLYTGYGVQARVTDKCVNATLIWGTGCGKTVFGSWSEYEAIAGFGPIKEFGSASGIGYDAGVGWDGSGGRVGGVEHNIYSTSFFNVSHLTIANNNTTGSPSVTRGGFSNISLDGAVLERIMSRYADSSDAINTCNIGYTSESYVYSRPDHVAIFRCNGTMTISGNIETGDTPRSQIDDIPQAIVIADNINITSGVNRVDAWLIATSSSSRHSASGAVNTCSDFRPRSTESTGPCSQLLTVNGPTIAKRLYLNRTAGAGPGDESIEPAERFNLRADTFLWAYSQAEDFHQAFTTYTRELAPRY